jgi:dinuclear metal center YbgI/SA1388 family protein
MRTTVKDIIGVMEELAPSRLAEQWDNVGLQVGTREWPVERIRVALDPGIEVVETACAADTDLLITHHPLILKPLAAIDLETETGRVIRTALAGKMAIYAAHTNLDSAANGLNDHLAQLLGLENRVVLVPAVSMDPLGLDAHGFLPSHNEGLGRIGDLSAATTLADLAADLKKRLDLSGVRVVGRETLHVDRIAVCTGSGAGLLDHFFASDAQVYVTGDLKYHDARAIEAQGRGAVDIGHFASEHIVVRYLSEQLGLALENRGIVVDIAGCGIERDPFIQY